MLEEAEEDEAAEPIGDTCGRSSDGEAFLNTRLSLSLATLLALSELDTYDSAGMTPVLRHSQKNWLQ